jgi:hypothetical protein
MALNASSLLNAARDGNVGTVRACIEAKVDVNSKDTVGLVYLCVSVSFLLLIVCFYLSDVLHLFCHNYIFVIFVVSIYYITVINVVLFNLSCLVFAICICMFYIQSVCLLYCLTRLCACRVI